MQVWKVTFISLRKLCRGRGGLESLVRTRRGDIISYTLETAELYRLL
jgi:hypothetical protein